MFPFRSLNSVDLKGAKRAMMDYHLKGRDITDPATLAAMEAVPREKFVTPSMAEHAYEDAPLSIGHGQTISQPYIVALMVQELRVGKADTVLEVGGGSGYQAAVLSRLAKHVYTTEIIRELADESAERLARLGYGNVTVRHCDGSLGWAEHAPFDRIIAAATARKVPQALEDQLADGGRIILPLGDRFFQDLVLGVKRGGVVKYRTVTAVRFVPMTGAADED